MNKMSNGKTFIFDLDGTIYRDGILIGDAKATLKFIREMGARVVYLTNNSSCTTETYGKKLRGLEILEKQDVIYSSLDCAVDFFKKYRNGKKVYALATKDVRTFLVNQGVELVNDGDPYSVDVVLTCFDKEINYQKIVIANDLLVLGKEYICTHPDKVCPTDNISIPDTGAFIEMFKASSGRVPDIILGKPYGYMAQFLVEKLGVMKEQTFMVGDRLYTDIAFGLNAGVNTIVVLSGETDLNSYENSQIKADYLLKDINEIPKLILAGK